MHCAVLVVIVVFRAGGDARRSAFLVVFISCRWRRAARCSTCCIYFLQVATRGAVLYLLYSFLAGGDARRGAVLRAGRPGHGGRYVPVQPAVVPADVHLSHQPAARPPPRHAGTGLKHTMSMCTQVRA